MECQEFLETRERLNTLRRELENVNTRVVGRQMICFLTGAGGTGKSKVIVAVIEYGKCFCHELGVEFTRRTIVVTALTGCAAVPIGGETTHSACGLFRDNFDTEKGQWKRAYLLIVDEVSFASRHTLTVLNEKLRAVLNPRQRYGGISIVFAGDFSQLPPVGAKPLFFYKDFDLWYDWVNCYLELTWNHRFVKDPYFGEILQRIRMTGPLDADVALLNERVLGSRGGPSEEDIPDDVVYAVKTNFDRNAINLMPFLLSI